MEESISVGGFLIKVNTSNIMHTVNHHKEWSKKTMKKKKKQQKIKTNIGLVLSNAYIVHSNLLSEIHTHTRYPINVE